MLHADDTALVAESREDFLQIANKFEGECNRKGLKINEGKSKVLGERGRVDWGEKVDKFKYK